MFACLPSYHHRAAYDRAYSNDLVFVGNNYSRHPARLQGINNILRPLAERGFDLKIFGNEWWLDEQNYFNINKKYYGGYLPNEKLPVVCASSKIVLGIHSVNNSLTMMSMRTFEVLGCGGFYLTQWTPAIENLFKNHYHLVWTKSADETIDLVKFYLDHPRERDKIALQGQQEVYAKHTYHHRANTIIEILGQNDTYDSKGLDLKIIRNKRIYLEKTY
jgi:spore maturation protein CgeB